MVDLLSASRSLICSSPTAASFQSTHTLYITNYIFLMSSSSRLFSSFNILLRYVPYPVRMMPIMVFQAFLSPILFIISISLTRMGLAETFHKVWHSSSASFALIFPSDHYILKSLLSRDRPHDTPLPVLILSISFFPALLQYILVLTRTINSDSQVVADAFPTNKAPSI